MEAKKYVEEVIEKVRSKNSNEIEFNQSVKEVLESLVPVLEKHPEYIEENILERLTEPDRAFLFRVTWEDDNGKIQVNKGYRVQFNGSIGPYKGGLRLHPSVYIGVIKFLAFEQVFKNSLTGLSIGGGKGGSDFDPKGKSDREIMRFCQSFMTELSKYIGPDKDVPAGDIGVGGREIGYLYGQYRKIRGAFENGVLTGKGLEYGGSLIRPEATGFGVTYFTDEILKEKKDDFKNKTVLVSGYGNVAWGTAIKVSELGGKVVTLSGSEGYIYDKDGVTGEKIEYMLEMRKAGKGALRAYATKYGAEFFEKQRPWNVKADIAIPCATQNEIDLEDAKNLVKNGIKIVAEGSNMPCTAEAVSYLVQNEVIVAPGKAANAGGVAVSALEMSQNSQRMSWTREKVDEELQNIMKNIHTSAKEMSIKYTGKYDLVAGANIAGFIKVANATIAQGII